MTVAQTTKYVIKYKLNGERRFEFAQLKTARQKKPKPRWKPFTARAKTSSARSASAKRCNTLWSGNMDVCSRR
jgi:hypothetical protein